MSLKERDVCIFGKNFEVLYLGAYEYKNATNLGKFYLPPKIHKCLNNVPGRPSIPNYGAPTRKGSEFLDFHLKRIMKNGASYIKDSNDFMNTVKNIEVSNDALLVTADIIGLYPSISHEAGLKALRNAIENRNYEEIPTESLLKMAEIVLKNN